MKHVKINGQNINLDKKWQHLKLKQKDWIFQMFRENYVEFLNKNKRHPNKLECDEIVNNVFNLIESKNIWISYNELKKAFCGKLIKYRKISINQ